MRMKFIFSSIQTSKVTNQNIQSKSTLPNQPINWKSTEAFLSY